jgi:hypothetical protein
MDSDTYFMGGTFETLNIFEKLQKLRLTLNPIDDAIA